MMEKNTILAIVLSVLVLVGFTVLQNFLYPPQAEQAVLEQPVENTVPEPAVIDASPVRLEAPAAAPLEEAGSAEDIPEETFSIKTNHAEVTFTNRGGDLISYKLLDHTDKGQPVEMADSITAKNRAYSLSLGKESARADIIDAIFKTEKIGNESITFSKTFADFSLIKKYTFSPDEYMFKLDIEVRPAGGKEIAYTLRSQPQIGPYFNAKVDRYEMRKFMTFTGQKRKEKRLNPGDVTPYDNRGWFARMTNQKQDKTFTWTGVGGKYFAVLLLPQNPESIETITYSSMTEVENYANAQLFLARSPVTASVADTFYIYVGPLTEKNLKIYNTGDENAWNLSGTQLNESLPSMGVLSWLEVILKAGMEIVYKVIPNWGVAIIIMTFFIKLLMFPLTRKSSVSTLKMQEIQPQLQALQAKYKDNPQKLNEEMAKFYKETGYNPMSGCFPLLIQFPIIIAMYNLFNNYFEFRGAPFIEGWIPDLSLGDSIYEFNFMIPFLNTSFLRLLPIIYVASQLLSGKITQTANTTTGAAATQMKIMMYGMPFIFFFIFYSAPSGLLIYWTVSNILQLFQQLLINRIMAKKRAEMAVAPKQTFVPRKKK
ncbi:MAG: membrane protein insertase YidC [Treponemataceae bacterium]|nr:MAG: membrane protein insertase YidC [Treponemataceae bacterium]